MIFESSIHGDLHYEESEIINFEKGLLGFNEYKKFILIDLKGYEPFKLLQSLEDKDIGIIVTSPFEFFKKYEFTLNKELLDRLKIIEENQVSVYTTVTLNSNPNKFTTNLKAPLIINTFNKCGEQIILDKEKYKIKHPLIKE